MEKHCPICDDRQVYVHYSGPIRTGQFESTSESSHQVLGCKNCQVRWLTTGGEAAEYYSTTEYIKEFDGSGEESAYFGIHDPVQLRHLEWVGTGALRSKSVADIGCGAGAFLDFAKGLARNTIGIDLNESFVKRLNESGHRGFLNIDQVDESYLNNIDVLTAFSMIEHVDDPLTLARQLTKLANSQTRLYMSTPNADDFLLDMELDAYNQFYYRKVHLWYFNEHALTCLLEKAGWKVEKAHYVQRFGLSNFISWVDEHRPTGDSELSFITPTMSECWRTELCTQKKADYFCVEAVLAE